MTTRKTSDNLLQLEQLAFSAGMEFMKKLLVRDLSDSAKLEVIGLYLNPTDHEVGMEEWRQLAIARSLEAQIMKGE